MFRTNGLYHIYLYISSRIWVVKYVFISIQYWSSCHYLRIFLDQKKEWVEINVFAMPPSSHGHCWVPFLYLWIVRTAMTLYGDKMFYSSAFCLYCMAWSVKSTVFNSVYTLYCFKYIFMSVEWYLQGASESLVGVILKENAFFTMWAIRPLFLNALCFITHLIRDQYSMSKT